MKQNRNSGILFLIKLRCRLAERVNLIKPPRRVEGTYNCIQYIHTHRPYKSHRIVYTVYGESCKVNSGNVLYTLLWAINLIFACIYWNRFPWKWKTIAFLFICKLLCCVTPYEWRMYVILIVKWNSFLKLLAVFVNFRVRLCFHKSVC